MDRRIAPRSPGIVRRCGAAGARRGAGAMSGLLIYDRTQSRRELPNSIF